MAKKGLIDSILIQELVAMRIDSGWSVISKNKDTFPRIEEPHPDEEGATGHLDNKGAVFIPGGLILQDSDKKPIKKIKYNFEDGFDSFRKDIRGAMKFDNATLLYHDGFASRVNLNNGFINEIAKSITEEMLLPRRTRNTIPSEIGSIDISRSYCPLYVESPDGSRTRVSSCVSLGLLYPVSLYRKIGEKLGIKEEDKRKVWNEIRSARKPIKYNGEILAHPHVVVAHSTRYKPETLTGITRILGYGKFGEFSTITLEEVRSELYEDCGITKKDFQPENVAIEYCGTKYSFLLREYPKTTPGKRSPRSHTTIISPEKDLKLNLEEISKESKERYKITDLKK